MLLLGNQCDRRKQIPFRRSWLVICRPQQSTVCQLMDVNTSVCRKSINVNTREAKVK